MSESIDPSTELTPPEVEGWFSTGGNMVDMALGNAYSVSYYLLQIIKHTTGWDPVGDVQNYLGGDWQALLKSAKAAENLAQFNTAYSDAVVAAVKDFETSWTGNAASSANEYFKEFTGAIDKQHDPLVSISDTIATFAWDAYGVAQAVQSLILELLDLALRWALTQAAAKVARATTATLYGAAAAAALEAVCLAIVAMMKAKALEVVRLLGQILAGSAAAVGTLYGLMGSAAELDMPVLHGEYNHPGVI
ncbi:hypothetical protein [Nocardia carnea]|uniref:hypothetical protein n=1 Tax=Nocardia carnea TaxID=37328 RepID=UPI002456FBBC|nr:hypothetical protein [Nocardia carnea]